MKGQREKGDGQGGERVERSEVVEVGWGVGVDEGRGKGRDALGEEGGGRQQPQPTPPAARRSAAVGTPCTSQGATTTRGHGTPPLTHCAPLAGASPLGCYSAES